MRNPASCLEHPTSSGKKSATFSFAHFKNYPKAAMLLLWVLMLLGVNTINAQGGQPVTSTVLQATMSTEINQQGVSRPNAMDNYVGMTYVPYNVYKSALKFDLQSFSGQVASAKLRLYITDVNTSAETLTIYEGTNDSWSENTTTLPAYSGTAYSGSPSFNIGMWVEVDVTNFITNEVSGDKVATMVFDYSTAIPGGNDFYFAFESDEGTNKPELVITPATPTVSTNANLSNLTLSAGTLTPAFSNSTISYTASVANATSAITLTPTVADANATVTINGVAVTSGNASGNIALNVGANTITVVVTAQDGTTVKTYTVTVNRAAPVVQIQAPVISYSQSSYSFTAGTAITSFALTNTGGSVPSSFAGAVTTFAGSGTQGFANGSGTSAQFSNPYGVVVDGSGNIYVGDYANHRIRKISASGVVSTFAGSGAAGTADGTGTAAQFNAPRGIAMDAQGNLYVVDNASHRIRKISPSGVVSTLAGSGTPGTADGTGTAAQFNGPVGVAVDGSGNVYVVDQVNNRIRKITTAGVVSTLAGSTPGYADGSGTAAKFNNPLGIVVDGSGNLYVSEVSNHRIRKISPSGVVSTFAGSGTPGTADGTGTAAQFNNPTGIAMDAQGNLYVNEVGNHRIRKITAAGVVSTLAGSTVGYADGSGTAAKFTNPIGVATDAQGNLYVADMTNQRIRKISLEGYSISPVLPAGLVLNNDGSISGTPTAASPATNYTITAINSGGSGSTVVSIAINAAASTNANLSNLSLNTGTLTPAFAQGTLTYSVSVINSVSSVDITPTLADVTATMTVNGTVATSGNAAAIPLNVGTNTITIIITAQDGTTTQTYTVAVNRAAPAVPAFTSTPLLTGTVGQLYSYTIRANDPGNLPLTLSGVTVPSWLTFDPNGQTTSTQFGSNITGPSGVASDASGNVYVTEMYGTAIYKIAPDGTTTPWFTRHSGEVMAMLVVGNNLFVSYHTGNANKITKINLTGTPAETAVTTQMTLPLAMAHYNGAIYVADWGANKVRKIDLSNNAVSDVLTYTRAYGLGFNSNGLLYIVSAQSNKLSTANPSHSNPQSTLTDVITSGLQTPADVKIDAAGNVYISGMGNVRKYTPNLSSYTTGWSGSGWIWNLTITPSNEVVFGLSGQSEVHKLQSGAVLTGTPALSDIGTHNVSIKADNGSANTTQDFTISVSGPSTFSLPNLTKNMGDAAFTITDPSSTNTSGAFTYTSSNPLVASVSGNTVTIAGEGTATITATQAAAGLYLQTQRTFTVTVSKQTPTIGSWSNISKHMGDAPFTITAPSSNSTGAFTYTSNNPSVATISGNIVTITGVGTATITATQAADANYNSGTATTTLTVLNAYPVIHAINPSPAEPGSTITISGDHFATATAVAINGMAAGSYTVVDAQTITAVVSQHNTSGAVTVTTQYGVATSNASLIIKQLPVITGFNNITKTYGDAAFDLTDPQSNSTGAFTYTSSDLSVVKIIGNTVTIVGAGTATITASQAADAAYLATSASVQIEVVKAHPVITGFANISKKYGEASFRLSAPQSNSNGAFTYISSDPAVAAINGNKVTIAGAGTATITATQAANANYNSNSVSVTIVITPKVLTVTPASQSKCVGAPMPAFSYSISGFAAGENESVLTQQPLASTAADQNSAAGTYAITVSGGAAANYSFDYKAGTLIVNDALHQAQRMPAVDAIKGEPTQLQARTFGTTYQWTPATGLSSATTAMPYAQLQQEQEYKISITESTGCVVVDTLKVRVFEKPDVFVPSLFSPNGDGINDVLRINAVSIKQLYYFRVFNKWGKMVFQTTNINEGWNGSFQGALQPFSTYSWLISGLDKNGKIINHGGSVTLVR